MSNGSWEIALGRMFYNPKTALGRSVVLVEILTVLWLILSAAVVVAVHV